MDTINHTRWGIALAAAALALTSACGADVTPSPNDIGGAGQEQPSTGHDSNGNRARLDFGDQGRP